MLIPIVSIGIALLFIPYNILFTWLSPLPNSIEHQVNDAIEAGLDGIIVYVDKAGAAPLLYSAGWKNRETQTPADPNALFKIASISKLYIAAASVKLADQDSLHLEKTLLEYLPEQSTYIKNAATITLKSMLKHRSGIPNYTDHKDYPWSNPYKDNSAPLQLIRNTPADFEPNTDFNYSNTNYLLIGEILDKTLGYSHHHYIKNEILEPLGLENTYNLLEQTHLEDVMSGYHVDYGPDIKSNDFIHPGSSMVATAQDVGIFLRALNEGQLFNDSEQIIYDAIYESEHTGLLPGYSSIARYYKDIDAVVVQLVNTSGGDSWALSEINYNRIVKILSKQ